jgi:hypothetical protein
MAHLTYETGVYMYMAVVLYNPLQIHHSKTVVTPRVFLTVYVACSAIKHTVNKILKQGSRGEKY